MWRLTSLPATAFSARITACVTRDATHAPQPYISGGVSAMGPWGPRCANSARVSCGPTGCSNQQNPAPRRRAHQGSGSGTQRDGGRHGRIENKKDVDRENGADRETRREAVRQKHKGGGLPAIHCADGCPEPGLTLNSTHQRRPGIASTCRGARCLRTVPVAREHGPRHLVRRPVLACRTAPRQQPNTESVHSRGQRGRGYDARHQSATGEGHRGCWPVSALGGLGRRWQAVAGSGR